MVGEGEGETCTTISRVYTRASYTSYTSTSKVYGRAPNSPHQRLPPHELRRPPHHPLRTPMPRPLLHPHLLHPSLSLPLADVQLPDKRLRRRPRHERVLLPAQHEHLLPPERVAALPGPVRRRGGVVRAHVREEGRGEVRRREREPVRLRARRDEREEVGAAWRGVSVSVRPGLA